MKLVLITDNAQLKRWQIAALHGLGELEPLLVLSCTNTRVRRRIGKHFLYYVMNSLCMRNPHTRSVPLGKTRIPVGEVLQFESEYDGAWQRLPDSVVERLKAEQPDAIIKFGMSLLRVPEQLPPILSYHHGDPDHYRGRPAGFWETLAGRPLMGQIVQVITNRLDAGGVVAAAETRIVPHSYRATLIDAYRHSPLLLGPALRNVLQGQRLQKTSAGPNYRLPNNLTVVGFAGRLAAALVKRFLYGTFFEKRWTVSTAELSEGELLEGRLPKRSCWSHLPRSRQHLFHADPFFYDEGDGVIVEAMNRSGKGELVLIGSNAPERLISNPRRHCSYPAPVSEDGGLYVVPETAQWSPPRIFQLGKQGLEHVAMLNLPNGERIVDPTFFRHNDRLYLFANKASWGSSALFLWSAPSLFGNFVEHPLSPVRISPRGGRMAGQLLTLEGSVYRPGQNYAHHYGEGVLLFRIDELGPSTYHETLTLSLRFDDVLGPHTVGFRNDRILFDWYQHRFSPLAGLRRLQGKLRN